LQQSGSFFVASVVASKPNNAIGQVSVANTPARAENPGTFLGEAYHNPSADSSTCASNEHPF
jgi:hypothetical protein